MWAAVGIRASRRPLAVADRYGLQVEQEHALVLAMATTTSYITWKTSYRPHSHQWNLFNQDPPLPIYSYLRSQQYIPYFTQPEQATKDVTLSFFPLAAYGMLFTFFRTICFDNASNGHHISRHTRINKVRSQFTLNRPRDSSSFPAVISTQLLNPTSNNPVNLYSRTWIVCSEVEVRFCQTYFFVWTHTHTHT